MANNILSYFIKDLSYDEKKRYKCIKDLNYITIYYTTQIIWQFCRHRECIYNYRTNICKSFLYKENRTSFLIIKNKKQRHGYTIGNQIYCLNKTKINFYFYKTRIEYINCKDKIYLTIKIKYLNGYIYRYIFYTIEKIKMNDIMACNIVFIPTKYELEFCSKLFYLF